MLKNIDSLEDENYRLFNENRYVKLKLESEKRKCNDINKVLEIVLTCVPLDNKWVLDAAKQEMKRICMDT